MEGGRKEARKEGRKEERKGKKKGKKGRGREVMKGKEEIETHLKWKKKEGWV